LEDKISDGAKSANPMKAPGIIKNGAINTKILASIPNVMKSSVESVKKLLTTIRDILQGKDVVGEA